MEKCLGSDEIAQLYEIDPKNKGGPIDFQTWKAKYQFKQLEVIKKLAFRSFTTNSDKLLKSLFRCNFNSKVLTYWPNKEIEKEEFINEAVNSAILKIL